MLSSLNRSRQIRKSLLFYIQFTKQSKSGIDKIKTENDSWSAYQTVTTCWRDSKRRGKLQSPFEPLTNQLLYHKTHNSHKLHWRSQPKTLIFNQRSTFLECATVNALLFINCTQHILRTKKQTDPWFDV